MHTGDTCPQSGIWSTRCCNTRIALSKGERFPPSRSYHGAAEWVLVQPTK